ncbi:hypothetical protein ACKWRH_05240 [Bradyrhizobium sp. Pa8]|uniref:hypothetical protein n=1 Tax=Bradyrhizobium sp. Pa8 TaxID=3386552 RepID=UPI00403F1211
MRVVAAIFVTLLINSSSNIHAHTPHGFVTDQQLRENMGCLTGIFSRRSFKLKWSSNDFALLV